MTRKKPNFLDDVIEAGREILDALQNALDPYSKKRRRPARVPVPVRNDRPGERRSPYDA